MDELEKVEPTGTVDISEQVEKIETDGYKARVDRCRPIAQKLLDILHANKASVKMGENDEVKKSVTPIAEQVIAMFLENDIAWGDRQFIFQLALQPMAHLGEVLETSFEISWDRALSHKWGKDAIDLHISDVHNALVDGAAKSKE